MGEDGEERPADFDQIVETTGLDPEQVCLSHLSPPDMIALPPLLCVNTDYNYLTLLSDTTVWDDNDIIIDKIPIYLDNLIEGRVMSNARVF